MYTVIHTDTDGISIIFDEKGFSLTASGPGRNDPFRSLVLKVENGELAITINDFDNLAI